MTVRNLTTLTASAGTRTNGHDELQRIVRKLTTDGGGAALVQASPRQ